MPLPNRLSLFRGFSRSPSPARSPQPTSEGPPPEYEEFNEATLTVDDMSADPKASIASASPGSASPHAHSEPPIPPPKLEVTPPPFPSSSQSSKSSSALLETGPLQPRPRREPNLTPPSITMPSAVVDDVVLQWDVDSRRSVLVDRSASSPWRAANDLTPSLPQTQTHVRRSSYGGQSSYIENAGYSAPQPFNQPFPTFPSSPTHPRTIVYTFVESLTHDAMVLLPPPTYPDPRPLYHIRVQMDYFQPSVHTTIIHRGDSESGPLVGYFKMGTSASKQDVISIDRQLWALDSSTLRRVDSEKGKMREGTNKRMLWHWNFGSLSLEWDLTNPEEKTCAMSSSLYSATTSYSMEPVATFTSLPESQIISHSSSPLAELVVMQHDLSPGILDYVVFTALIMQRERFDKPFREEGG